ncbi:hypothetical protein GWI33_004331 [Rhynchophorus ferrugineus]|uniref:Uncharacterized protein n=1 Tax=Rhynchophorus ferrugineus TaxID=354439 RepID=A0A834IYU8_RHYFE|nr:hypothetical protein GWI33_004331 [Rhynchophorus ferrugineus]
MIHNINFRVTEPKERRENESNFIVYQLANRRSKINKLHCNINAKVYVIKDAVHYLCHNSHRVPDFHVGAGVSSFLRIF